MQRSESAPDLLAPRSRLFPHVGVVVARPPPPPVFREEDAQRPVRMSVVNSLTAAPVRSELVQLNPEPAWNEDCDGIRRFMVYDMNRQQVYGATELVLSIVPEHTVHDVRRAIAQYLPTGCRFGIASPLSSSDGDRFLGLCLVQDVRKIAVVFLPCIV